MTEEEEKKLYSMMCGKCGDRYTVKKEYKEKYQNVRWRCRSCLYSWI